MSQTADIQFTLPASVIPGQAVWDPDILERLTGLPLTSPDGEPLGHVTYAVLAAEGAELVLRAACPTDLHLIRALQASVLDGVDVAPGTES